MTAVTPVDPTTAPVGAAPATAGRSLADRLGLVRFSGLYGLVALIVLFSALYPATFDTEITLKTTLGDQSITALLALGAIAPLAAGLIDLSFGAIAGFGLIFVSWLSTQVRVSDAVLVVVTLAACMCFGAVSSLLVAYLNVNSLVVTLGMSTLALGLAEKISGENTLIPRLGSSLDRLGGGSLFGIPMTFVILVVAAAAALYWLEYTPSGRYVLAAGDNPVAARLAGVPVRRIQVGVLVASSLVAGCTGILLAGKIGEASTVTANGYLLPAIAGLFLGATQVKPRVNVLGTLIAIYLIGVGVKGLQLAGSQAWVSDVFNGAVLLLAIALTARRSRAAG